MIPDPSDMEDGDGGVKAHRTCLLRRRGKDAYVALGVRRQDTFTPLIANIIRQDAL